MCCPDVAVEDVAVFAVGVVPEVCVEVLEGALAAEAGAAEEVVDIVLLAALVLAV